MRARYGASFVSSNPDRRFAYLVVELYTISYYMAPRYIEFLPYWGLIEHRTFFAICCVSLWLGYDKLCPYPWGLHQRQYHCPDGSEATHNGRDSVSNHQPPNCLLNRLFRRRSKKQSKLRVTGRCAWNWPVNSQHKWPATPKRFPFDDVIMPGQFG